MTFLETTNLPHEEGLIIGRVFSRRFRRLADPQDAREFLWSCIDEGTR